MGWNSQVVIAQLVIIEGPSDGLFVYSGTPASGNLIASIASTAGVDSFGNAYRAGFTSYSATSAIAQLLAGIISVGITGDSALASLSAAAGQTELLGDKATPADIQMALNLLSRHATGGAFTQATFTDGNNSARLAINEGSAQTTAQLEVNGSLAVGPSLGSIREWYAPSGGDDFAALNTALSSYGSADLLPATYALSADLTVAGATLQGCDEATIVTPFGAYAGVLMTAGTKGVIRNLSVQNSGSDAIHVAAGISEPWLLDLYFASNAGLCISAPSVTAPLHARIRGIRGAGGGSANGGGINLDGGTGGAVTCEANISDIDIQGVTASEVLRFQGVTDVLVNKVNGSMAAGVAANAISVLGACQTVHLLGLDVGGDSSSPAVCMLSKGASVNSPTDCWVKGKLQSGLVGLVVNDAVARSRFQVDCTRNQGDGAQFNGTGQVNKLLYMGNLNNQAAGVAYDINVTSSVHLYIDAPQYGTPGGGAVTANLNCAIAGNHVSHSNPPAGSTSVGFAPAGW